MQFFIDGSLCFDRSWIPAAPLAAPEPFDHPFNLVLTMGVGSEPASNRVTSGDHAARDVHGRLRQGLALTSSCSVRKR